MAVINNIPNTIDNSTFYEDYNAWSIRILANDGYKFTENGSAEYEDENGDFHNEVLTPNGRGNMLSSGYLYDTTANTEITVNGAVVDATIMAVVNNIQNTTATAKKTGSETAEVKIICNNGYKFESAPKITYTDYYGEPAEATATLNADSTEATATLTDNDGDSVTLTGSTVKAGTPEITVNNGIAKTTETHEYDGQTATITITGSYPRYRFVNPSAAYTAADGTTKNLPLTVVVGDMGSTATAVITDLDPTKPVNITGSYVNVCHVEARLSNCTSAAVLPDYYLQGSKIEITLNANDGTEFNTAPTLSHENEMGYYVEKRFTVAENKKSASIVYQLPEYDVSSISINAEAEPISVIGGNYGAINVYIVTLDNLADFAKIRFFKQTTDQSGNTNFEYIDLGKYVNRIKRIFCNIASSSTDVIKCGNWNTNISVFQPATDKITLDFGSVLVPANNGDSADYESEISLFIPFAGFVSLPSDYCGESVNLQMEINVITGNGVAKLYYNGVLFNVIELTPSADVLFRTADTELTLIGSDSWNERLYYGLEPYLFVKWFESQNKTGRNNTLTRDVIGNFMGFNVFANITPITAPTMLADEQTAIYEALKRGVYIE